MSDLCPYTEDESLLCGPNDPYPCGPCQKLAQMQEKIKEAMMILDDLKQERQRLKEQAQQKHTHEPYIHRLPPEVTANIFILCIPDYVATMHVPLLLSRICGHWRTIAHSTPQLWNTLGLQLKTYYSKFNIPSSLLVKEWIDRTGDLPLSINFCITMRPEGTIDGIVEIIMVLNEHSVRWRELNYSGLPRFLSLFSDNKGLAQQLRTLCISGISGYLSNPEFNFHPTRLDALSVSGTQLVAIFQLDLNHLTELTLDDVLPSECVEALRKAPQLNRCNFGQSRRVLPDEINIPLPSVPVVLPKVEHLEFIGDTVLYRILEHLSCPSLKILLLKGSRISETAANIMLLAGFLRQSKCPLEKFMLSEFNLGSSPNFTVLYKELPMLQDLDFSFNFSVDSEAILSPLSEISTVIGRKQPLYLPLLHSFALKIHQLQDWKMLPDIFGTRVPSAHSVELHRDLLKSISIIIENPHWNYGKQEMDQETLENVQWLSASADVNWSIRSGYGGEDLIALAVKIYSSESM